MKSALRQISFVSKTDAPEGARVGMINCNQVSTARHNPEPIGLDHVQKLLSRAFQTPKGLSKKSCAFAVLQDEILLKALSCEAKKYANKAVRDHLRQTYREAESDIFYGAGTLVVIYGDCKENSVLSDHWLVAEDLMLHACSMGFSTCLIGLAIPALNSLDWKSRLGIPRSMNVIAPIVVGNLKSEIELS